MDVQKPSLAITPGTLVRATEIEPSSSGTLVRTHTHKKTNETTNGTVTDVEESPRSPLFLQLKLVERAAIEQPQDHSVPSVVRQSRLLIRIVRSLVLVFQDR